MGENRCSDWGENHAPSSTNPVSNQDSSHVKIGDKTVKVSNAGGGEGGGGGRKQQNRGVSMEASPSILLDVSVTGHDFVLATTAKAKNDFEASTSTFTDSNTVSEQQ